MCALVLAAAARTAAPQDPGAAARKDAADARSAQEANRRRRELAGTREAWGISPDGTLLAAGSPACNVEVWRATGRAPFAVLKGHTSLVTSVAIQGDGKRIYASAEDGTIRRWDVATGKVESVIGKPNEVDQFQGGQSVRLGYRSVATSRDGRYAVFLGYVARVWDWTSESFMKEGPVGLYPDHARFLADSRRVVIVWPNEIKLYDLTAAPTTKSSAMEPGKTYVTLEPVWGRRRPGFGAGRADPSDLEAGVVEDTCVLESAGVVVTLARPDGPEKNGKTMLRAYDLKTGARRWETAMSARRFLHAPKAASLLVEDEGSVRFVAPATGKVVKTLTPQKPLVPRLMTPDGSAWFDADRDGNLTRVPTEPSAPPPGVPPPAAPPGGAPPPSTQPPPPPPGSK
jgi:hypothetical protein